MSAVDGHSMSCRELVELVTAYLEDALPASDRERFDAHLAICPPCVGYVRQIEVTIAAARATRDELERAPAVTALLGAFRDWKREAAAS